MDIDLKQLRDLMRAIRQFDVTALTVEKNGERIELRRAANGSTTRTRFAQATHAAYPQTSPTMLESLARPPAADQDKRSSKAEDTDHVYVTSPFVGTFFRSLSPGEPPYVEVGRHVSPGQTLCIIEAMKLMNEIESEYSGTVEEILVENGKPVEYGDRLFKIRLG